MIRFVIASAAFMLVGSSLSAATSYLLVQSEFDGASTATSYAFEVNYTGTQLVTGQNLLNAVFGVPTLSTTGNTAGFYVSSNTINGVQYSAEYSNSAFGFFVTTFSIDGHQGGVSAVNPANGQSDLSYFWGTDVAGGGYHDVFPPVPVDGTYPDGVWGFGNTGADGRRVADQSFDAWVFGQGDPDNPNDSPLIDPTAVSFNSASPVVVNLSSAPEPSRAMLLLCGGLLGLMWRRRPTPIPMT